MKKRPIVAGRWRAMWNSKKICSCHNLFVLFRCACVCVERNLFTISHVIFARFFDCSYANKVMIFFSTLFFFVQKEKQKKSTVFGLSPMHKIKSKLLLYFICNIFNFLSAFPFEACKFYMLTELKLK